MILDPLLDVFRGKAATIPPMDGPLRPNTALESAAVAATAAAPDNLCFDGRRVLYSSGCEVRALDGGAPVARFEAPVTALAASPRGELAVALDDGRLLLGGRDLPAPGGLASPTALAFGDGETLYLCQGSARHPASDWVVDLMEGGATGSVWRMDLRAGSAACLARDLAFPYGLLMAGEDLILAESWHHRLLRLPAAGGTPRPLLAKLPGYPARLAPAAAGGAWLALFAPRNRLIEFVLEEEAYRADMMREVPRDFWIAPALSSGTSFLEPLQCGGVKTMGVHKPWSPSRSFGLVVRLDAAFRPVASFHSRANGARHGITSVVEAGGRVLAAAKGGGAILDLALAAEAGHALGAEEG
jgi:Strictosidine synthase